MALARTTTIYDNGGFSRPTVGDSNGSYHAHLCSIGRYDDDHYCHDITIGVAATGNLHVFLATGSEDVADFKSTCDDNSWWVALQAGV